MALNRTKHKFSLERCSKTLNLKPAFEIEPRHTRG